jgi:hypothetical protein
MTTYYTISDFNKMAFSGTHFALPDSISQIIKHLASTITPTDDVPSTNKVVKPKHVKPSDHRSRDTEDWSTVRSSSFKVTKLEVKEGTEKTIKEIRIALNKFSNKNADVQQNIIIQLINKVSDDSENKDEDMKKVINMIFEVVSSNEFYSLQYAKLYKDLIEAFPVFADKITDIIENYKSSFDNIKLVDPNVDYDGYCAYVKSNDARRAMLKFISNLTKIGVIECIDMLNIIVHLENVIVNMAEKTDSSVIIEETTENIFIAISENKDTLYKTTMWADVIIPNIHMISKLRKTDPAKYPSMSNRAVFKFMDIIDSLSSAKK